MPSIFALGPRDFFTVSPLGLIRRFADEMDRAFSNLGGVATPANEEVGWMPAIVAGFHSISDFLPQSGGVFFSGFATNQAKVYSGYDGELKALRRTSSGEEAQ